MQTAARNSARIRSLRPARPAVDLSRPLDVVVEDERLADGGTRRSLAVFLAGAECPFTCNFCDLWRYTVETATPPGAIPQQLKVALTELPGEPLPTAIKLYNASNFFDPRAVPPPDLEAIANLVEPFDEVTVECHPRLLEESCWRFAERLSGRLEVAMGLETVHPRALPALNKQMTLEDYASASLALRRRGIGVRAFALLSPPYVPRRDCVRWAIRTIEFALDRGAEVVSLIPVRTGNGELERLAEEGHFEPADLVLFERAMIGALELGRGVVLADLWDVDRLGGCPTCREQRLASLRSMNRTGSVRKPFRCPSCDQTGRV